MAKPIDQLIVAIESGDYNDVIRIISAGVDVNEHSSGGLTPLHHAVWLNPTMTASDPEMIMTLLFNAGADPDKLSGGTSPLHSAIYQNREYLAELILEHDANVNIKQCGGWTPLHLAVDSCIESSVKLLLEYGADPTIKDDSGHTAYDMAVKIGVQSIIAQIIGPHKLRIKLRMTVNSGPVLSSSNPPAPAKPPVQLPSTHQPWFVFLNNMPAVDPPIPEDKPPEEQPKTVIVPKKPSAKQLREMRRFAKEFLKSYKK
jgi:ankyrin repeat protein